MAGFRAHSPSFGNDTLYKEQRLEEGKDKESIQSRTTPDPSHHMGK